MTIAMSRRRWIAALLAVTTAGVLTACVSAGAAPTGDPTPSATPSASGLLPAAEAKTVYPLTLKSAWGETVLRQRPKRIAIATGANDLDNTLALGVTPVWADDWQASYEWTTAAGSAKVERRGEVTDTIPVEDIAASEPDLISPFKPMPASWRTPTTSWPPSPRCSPSRSRVGTSPGRRPCG